jgi:4-alpha-glucanotransferase
MENTPRSVQDWLSLTPRYYSRSAKEETINDPTNPNHYWRWRMQPSIEDLLADRHLIGLIQTLINSSGRAVRQIRRPL